jgi:ubiquinone/menaquinone biosynthesis C-methylase UbiE
MKVYEPLIAPRKRQLFDAVHGDIVEIGPGTGPNLKYFPKDVRWTGVESNPHMRKYLEREASRVGLSVHLIDGTAMSMPLEDESVEIVVGTLVLCSVPCPDTVLAEVRRVLKPGGRYLFVEHVAAPEGTWKARIQRFIKPIWHCCADGCNVDRRSWEPLNRAGFTDVKYERFDLPFPIVSPHMIGVAVK